jgi:hypothetical protein
MWRRNEEGEIMARATVSQRRYIKTLISECERRGIELPCELLETVDSSDLTVDQASEIIDALKMELGGKE